MKKRLIIWAICLIGAFICFGINWHIKSQPKEKTVADNGKNILNMYNDIGNEDTIKAAFTTTNLSSKNELEFVSKTKNAKCILTKDISGISDDDNANDMVTSYTPLIIGMKNSVNLQKYKNNKLIASSKEITNSAEDEITIDFKKVIDAVIEGENWSKFGGEDKAINIIVPEDDSIEGKIFYNFLLVTINNGSYPSDDNTLSDVKQTANSFLKLCEEKENVVNELKKMSSVNSIDLYILFEADFINSSIWNQKKLDISIAYPNTTVVKHIYMQSDQKQQEQFSTFFDLVSTKLNYRTSNTHSFTIDKNYNVKEDISFIEVPIEEDELAEGDIVMIVVLSIMGVMLILGVVIGLT